MVVLTDINDVPNAGMLRKARNDMNGIRYEDLRELAKIASENNVEITVTVDKEGLSVNIEKSRPMSITTTTTESEE